MTLCAQKLKMRFDLKPRLHRGNNVQHSTCRTLLHVSCCRTLRHTTTCSIMLHASTLFTPNHQIFLIHWETTYRYIIGNNCCYCVFGDCGRRRAKQEKERPRRWWRRKMFCSGNEHRDVLFTELIFYDRFLFRNFTRLSEFDFNHLLHLTRLFQNVIPVISTAFKQILDWL
jgi:hypothetical protein